MKKLKGEKLVKVIDLVVEGMNCGGCVKKITEHFMDSELIEKVDVSLEENFVKIVGSDDLSNMAIRNDLIELGFIVKSLKKS